MEDKINIDKIIADALTEKPITFSIDGHFFYVYPPSLGTTLLAQGLVNDIELDKNLTMVNEQLAILDFVHNNRENLLRYIALHTFRNKKDAIYEHKVQKRIKDISDLEESDILALMLSILDWNNWQKDIEAHFHIDKQREQRAKINKKKDKGSSITLGGLSLWGSLLDFAGERYGWSSDYVLWGISYLNMTLMANDCINSIYLTDEERKSLHISTDGIYINADSKEANKKIKELFS